MILLYHSGGPLGTHLNPKPCFGPALGVVRKVPLTREAFPADNVLKFDGTHPQRGETVICGTCGRPIHVSWLSYSEE